MPDTVPNQKSVTIRKEPCDRQNLYAKVNLDALQEAMKTLSNAEFVIWTYFAKNQEGFTFALSPQAADDWGNIARTTFNRTIRKFIEEGYLIADNNGSNHYTFYEKPKEKGTFTPYYGAPRVKEEGHDFSF